MKSLTALAALSLAFCLAACSKKETVIVNVKENPVKFVDLGLSVNWAESNLGADSPEQSGFYYAFAETQPKNDYRMETYKWAAPDAKGHYQYTKYKGSDVVLDDEDDAALVASDSRYRIPTVEEMQELVDSCTWTWSELGMVTGYKVESNVAGYEGRYIFIPAMGLREGTDEAITGFEGYYLTRSLYETGPYRLAFSPKGLALTVTSTRYNGFSIRPVAQKPKPLSSDLKIFTDDMPVREFTCKESAAHGKIFVEVYTSSMADKGYIPYMLCLDNEGGRQWGWTPISNRKSASSANWTMYDVSSDGGVIDCFSAITGETMIEDETVELHNPFVSKLDGNGNPLWGTAPDRDVQLHEFSGDFMSCGPIGSYTVCDNAGGAWVAAWNVPADQDILDKKICSEMVFVHLDRDGNKISPEITMNNASGTSGQKGIVTRAQMYTDDNNTLYALVLYDDVGTVSIIYYDLVVISSDGSSVTKKLLVSERPVLGEVRAKITKDGKGGAYVTLSAVNEGDDCNHLYLYHIDAAGDIDARDIDLTPEYCTTGITVGHAIEPSTGNIAVISMDKFPPGAPDAKERLQYMVLNSRGEKIISDGGKPVVLRESTGRNSMSNDDLKVIYRPEAGNIYVSYIYEGYMMLPQMKSFNIDFQGNATQERTIFYIDRNYYNNIDEESQVYDFVNGNLLYFFRPNTNKIETKDFYGYVLKR